MAVHSASSDGEDELIRARMDIAALKQIVQVLMIGVAMSMDGKSNRKNLQKLKETIIVGVSQTKFTDPGTAEAWRKHMEDVVSRLIDPLIEVDA